MARTRTDLGDAYIVSDGMGGHKAGALAAEITVEILQRRIAAIPKHGDLKKEIKEAFTAANAEVHRKAHSGDAQTEGMGATAVVLLALRSSVVVAHVGDSRAYLMREGKLQPLTKDHTRVQRMLAAGMLTEQQAKEHPDAGLLERVIGYRPDVDVDVSEPIELEYGDELLLCSDGLYSYVEHAQIEAVLGKPITPSEQVDELVALSLANGGQDNVTVQVIKYEGGMNDRRRQILTYQLAFLPLVVLIAGATAYGVDYANHRPPSTADNRASAAAASVAPTSPRVDTKAESTVTTLQRSVEELRDRVDQLNNDVNRLRVALDSPPVHAGGGASASKSVKGEPEQKTAKTPGKPSNVKGGSNPRATEPASATKNTPAPVQNPPASGENTNAPPVVAPTANSATPSEANQGAVKADTTVNAGPAAPAAGTPAPPQ